MEKNIKNKKISSLIKREMAKIFLLDPIEKGIILSISQVLLTNNIVNAKIYLSIFPIKKTHKVLITIKKKSFLYRKILGKRLRNQLKIIPFISFYIDESLNCLYNITQIK